MSSTTSLQLLNNYIRLLDQSLFEELITAMLPSGKILLDGNPLACGCEIAWVVTNTDYKAVVSDARCVNGTRLVNLDPNYFLQNCWNTLLSSHFRVALGFNKWNSITFSQNRKLRLTTILCFLNKVVNVQLKLNLKRRWISFGSCSS